MNLFTTEQVAYLAEALHISYSGATDLLYRELAAQIEAAHAEAITRNATEVMVHPDDVKWPVLLPPSIPTYYRTAMQAQIDLANIRTRREYTARYNAERAASGSNGIPATDDDLNLPQIKALFHVEPSAAMFLAQADLEPADYEQWLEWLTNQAGWRATDTALFANTPGALAARRLAHRVLNRH